MKKKRKKKNQLISINTSHQIDIKILNNKRTFMSQLVSNLEKTKFRRFQIRIELSVTHAEESLTKRQLKNIQRFVSKFLYRKERSLTPRSKEKQLMKMHKMTIATSLRKKSNNKSKLLRKNSQSQKSQLQQKPKQLNGKLKVRCFDKQ